MFHFDRVIERRGTHASKWDNIARLSGIESPDAIPMWVADMDFSAPPGVTSALSAEIQRAVHAITQTRVAGQPRSQIGWRAAMACW
jgi:cystathionine beta-lyase